MSLVVLLLLSLVVGGGWVGAQVYLSQPQALHAAFANSTVERKTVFLSADQKKKIEALAGVPIDSSIISYYVARGASGIEGTAFFDRRMVRTLPVTYMAVVTPAGAIDHVDVLSFDEPDDYLPPVKWLDLYRRRVLNQDMLIGHAIPHITGASLTSQAMNDGLRLILATYQVVIQPVKA